MNGTKCDNCGRGTTNLTKHTTTGNILRTAEVEDCNLCYQPPSIEPPALPKAVEPTPRPKQCALNAITEGCNCGPCRHNRRARDLKNTIPKQFRNAEVQDHYNVNKYDEQEQDPGIKVLPLKSVKDNSKYIADEDLLCADVDT